MVEHYFDTIAARRGWSYDMLRGRDMCTDEIIQGTSETTAALRRIRVADAAITIWPDFDMDGIASGTVLYAALAEMGFNVHMVIPDYTGSRAMTRTDIDHILAVYPDTQAIITSDGGITSNTGLDYAHDLGITTIVTDHHQENPAQLCIADFVVNPNRADSTYPEKGICGAQVAYMLMCEYAKRYQPDDLVAVSYLRIFAGFGALADVMPLIHRSRADVKSALTLLKLLTPTFPRDNYGRIDAAARDYVDTDTTPLTELLRYNNHHPYYTDAFTGVAALIRELGFAGKLYDTDNYDESIIGFTIAPMFNATRRIEADMAYNMAVFTPSVVRAYTDAGHSDIICDPGEAVRTLMDGNERRKQITAELLGAINDHPDHPFAPYVFINPQLAPAGFLGLLATQLLGATAGAACIVINRFDDGTFSGSARAVDGYSVLEAADRIPGMSAAGHDQACGVSFSDENAIAAFTEDVLHFEQSVAQETPTTLPADLNLLDMYGTPLANVPAELRDAMDTNFDADKFLELVGELERMRPFGKGFEYPTITVTIDPAQCTVTPLKRGRHTKITTASGLTLLAWNTRTNVLGETIRDAIAAGDIMQCVIQCGINTFMGVTSPQGIIQGVHRVHI